MLYVLISFNKSLIQELIRHSKNHISKTKTIENFRLNSKQMIRIFLYEVTAIELDKKGRANLH